MAIENKGQKRARGRPRKDQAQPGKLSQSIKITLKRTPAKEPGKAGRPTAFRDGYLVDGQKLAALGLSLRDMAYLWDLAPRTVQYWAEKKPDFCAAIKKGEGEKRSRLLTAMMSAAMKGSAAVQIFLAKNWLGMKDWQDHSLGGGDKPVLIKIVPVRAFTRGKGNGGGNGDPRDQGGAAK